MLRSDRHDIQCLMRMLSVLFLAAVLLFVVGQEAYAQNTAGTRVSNCDAYVGLTNKIVTCIRESVTHVTGLYFKQFYPLVQRIVAGFLTLGVAIYGTLAAFGMIEKVGRDTMVLVIKIAFITYFVTNSPVIYDYVTRFMDAAGETVIAQTPNTTPVSGSGGGSQRAQCLQTMKANSAGKAYSGAWLSMDCMIDSVVGIKVPTDNSGITLTAGSGEKWYNQNLKGRGMARGLLFVFFSSLQTSVLGALIAIIGFVFLYSLVFLIIKALFVFISGYLGVAFLVIFSPIFIPLVLFRTTKQYFDKWVKLLISFMLQPVLIMVFIMFAITAIDLAMFSGNYSVMYRIAGDASRAKGFNLNDYLTKNEAIRESAKTVAQVKAGTDKAGISDPNKGGVVTDNVNSDCTEALMRNDPELKAICEQVQPIQLWRNEIDWKKLAEIRTPKVTVTGDVRPEQQISREVLAAVIFAGIVVFVMNGLLKLVPVMTNDLLGESFQSPNLYHGVTRRSGVGRAMSGIASSMSGSLRGMFGGGRQ